MCRVINVQIHLKRNKISMFPSWVAYIYTCVMLTFDMMIVKIWEEN